MKEVDILPISRPTVPSVSLFPEVVDELDN